MSSHCYFCSRVERTESGQTSSTMSRTLGYEPWFCSDMCCSMAKHRAGLVELPAGEYDKYLKSFYASMAKKFT